MDWDTSTGRNIAWSVELGDETFGRPVVSGGVVYIGTDNGRPRNPAFADECGVLMAFGATDGRFLWQDLAPRVKRGTGEFLLPSTTSAPLVEGNRLYYVTAECQLRCLDTRRGEMVWELDMPGRLGVFPHEASNSDVLPIGDLLMVCTSNGRNEGHTRVPSPRAPSLIAVDKHSGNVVWRAVGAGEHVLHGQWSSPAAADVGGRTQVLFGGGDGWLRAYDAQSGREIWRFDGNPKDARWLPRPRVFSRRPITASPVYADGRVFIAMGDDPSHGDGPSLLHAISPNGQGDVTDSRRLWTSREIGRVDRRADRAGWIGLRRRPGRTDHLPRRRHRRPRLEARDGGPNLGLPAARRRAVVRRQRGRPDDRASRGTRQASAGADRDGLRAVRAARARGRCPLSGDRAAAVSDHGEALIPRPAPLQKTDRPDESLAGENP